MDANPPQFDPRQIPDEIMFQQTAPPAGLEQFQHPAQTPLQILLQQPIQAMPQVIPTASIQLNPAALERVYRPHKKEKAPKPELIHCKLDDLTVRGLLTRDFICRQTRFWMFLSREQMEKIFKDTHDLRMYLFPNFVQSGLGNSNNVGGHGMGDFFWTNRQHDHVKGDGFTRVSKLTLEQAEQAALQKINHSFPLTKELLQEFSGKLIVAGGAVFKSLFFGPEGNTDIDFFFVDPEVERTDVSDSEKIEKADALLEEVVSWLAGRYLSSHGLIDPQQIAKFGNEEEPETLVCILRSEHVVTVHVRYHGEWIKYQFIKRIYPSEASVLGGFDLGPSMIGYRVNISGKEEIVGTELGIWSAFASTIIVDTSRRSTSFEYRLCKYNKKCHLIFPGLARNVQPDLIIPRGDVHEDLIEMARKYRLVVGDGGDWSIGFKQDLVGRKDFLVEIRALAIAHGYKIEGLEDLSITPLDDSDDDRSESHLWECIEALKVKAHSRGYSFDVEEFGGSYHSRLAGYDDDYADQTAGLNFPLPRLRLPYLDISYVYVQVENSGGRRIIEVPRKCGVLGDQFEPRHSDYESNRVWSVYVVDQNMTKLIHNKINDVVSVVCLKDSSTRLDDETNIGFVTRQAKPCARMESCVVNIDRSRKSVGELVGESLRTVNLGDVLRSFRERADQIWTEAIEESWDGLYLTNGKHIEAPKRVFGDQAKRFLQIVLGQVVLDREVPLISPDLDYLNQHRNAKEALFSDMEARICWSSIAAHDKLTAPSWILRNQGRQWTSSNNPIMRHPKDWYGERYRSFRIGCESVETTLRLIRLRKGNDLQLLPLDVFKIILIRVVWANSFLF